jgi:hypothetical protein
MKRLFLVIMAVFTALLCGETLFEVKDASNNKVLDVTTDGLTVLNNGDTIMVIASQGIKAFIQPDAKDKALSRTFAVTTTASKDGAKAPGKVFEIATDAGATFYNPSDNTDEIFSISKSGITANVNPALNREFEVNDQVSSKGSGNLMKISNDAVFEAVNDSTMLWYKDKNAFRIGYVLITDPLNVGQGSFASGYQSQASGKFASAIGYKANASNTSSFASGNNAISSGINSCAIGYFTQATNTNAFASGYQSVASGQNSCAIGSGAEAKGTNSFAAGYGAEASTGNSCAIGLGAKASGSSAVALGSALTVASGDYSTAIGSVSVSSGNYSTSIGIGTQATGVYATAMGRLTTAQASNSFVVGRYNVLDGSTSSWINTDPLFVVGNGSGTSDRSNAFEVQKNGVVFIPSLYTTTSNNSKLYVQVDTNGKLCVPGKGEYPGSDEVDKLKEENSKLRAELEQQNQRIAKLEETLEKILK